MENRIPIKRIIISILLTVLSLVFLKNWYLEQNPIYLSFNLPKINKEAKINLLWTKSKKQILDVNNEVTSDYTISEDNRINFEIKTSKLRQFYLFIIPNDNIIGDVIISQKPNGGGILDI